MACMIRSLMLDPTEKGMAGLDLSAGEIKSRQPVKPLFSEGLDSTGGAFAGRANHNGAFAAHIKIFCCYKLVPL